LNPLANTSISIVWTKGTENIRNVVEQAFGRRMQIDDAQHAVVLTQYSWKRFNFDWRDATPGEDALASRVTDVNDQVPATFDFATGTPAGEIVLNPEQASGAHDKVRDNNLDTCPRY
jgi:hypothetical protein